MAESFKMCEVLFHTNVRISGPSLAISVGKHDVLPSVAKSLALRAFPVREFQIDVQRVH
jgi:hypothetical protein